MGKHKYFKFSRFKLKVLVSILLPHSSNVSYFEMTPDVFTRLFLSYITLAIQIKCQFPKNNTVGCFMFLVPIFQIPNMAVILANKIFVCRIIVEF